MAGSSRREFLGVTAATAAGLGACRGGSPAPQGRPQALPGDRPKRAPGVEILNPRTRVPLSFIIDDSTTLVNAAHFKIPQFAELYPDRYTQDWRSLPREIPDAFVAKFVRWCHDRGVKGKYSIIPYPACVGWVDRRMPGWTYRELQDSLKLVREEVMIDWDIHPEMVTHTFGVNTRTGRPYADRSVNNYENFGFSVGKSVDFLADYLAYALRILKNAGLSCEGVTTPGGFGSRVLPELSQAALISCRDVFNAEIPHYFRHTFTDERSVAPRVEYASGLDGADPRCVVSVVGCTADWFGGWDGLKPGDPDKFITPDLKGGRMVDVIGRGEPAIMVCHWAGIYFNGQEKGFEIFKTAVTRLHQRYENVLWMKLSEIARYWAAKELTASSIDGGAVTLRAPFASPLFTVRVPARGDALPKVTAAGKPVHLIEVKDALDLDSGRWLRTKGGVVVCFDLPKGTSTIATA